MKKNYFLISICAVITFLSACSKDGLTGPEGPAGLQGETGITGAVGPIGAAGKDGSIIYGGTGAPALTIGVIGDYYLDKNTANLYGPKTSRGWGIAIMLMGAAGTNGINGTNGTNGATGAAGTNGTNGATGTAGSNGMNGTNGAAGANGVNGSTTLSNIGAPSSSIGKIGDYFLDKASYQLYGPKNADGWGLPILLRGADGVQGPMGPAGADGSVIYGGDYYPDATIGKVGDYYFGRYIVQFFGPKTATGWGTGTSLKGTNGIDGTNGTNGVSGTNGTNGTNGSNGSTVRNGIGVPNNSLGATGDFYINLATYLIYGPKAASGWGVGTSLKGADGNANVYTFETTDISTFYWLGQDFNGERYDFNLQMTKNTAPNDTVTVFKIPQPATQSVINGAAVLVYAKFLPSTLTPASDEWVQLPYTGLDGFENFNYKINTTSINASIRIYANVRTGKDSEPRRFNKLRFVVIPKTISGVISTINKNTPLLQTMQKLNISDKDFKKLN